MDEQTQAIATAFYERLREALGSAWSEPLRVDGLVRFKMRPQSEGVLTTRWFGTITFTFEKVVMLLEINCGERIITKLRG